MRRMEHRVSACAATCIALSWLACCSAANDAQLASATAPSVSGPSVSGAPASAAAGATAADSGGRAASPTMATSAASAGTAAQPSNAAGAGGLSGGSPSVGASSATVANGAGASGATSAAGASAAGSGSGGSSGAAAAFILTPVDFPMAGDELTFPQTANPPTNQSPELTWTGVPAGAKTLALAFRDLGNAAVKWIIWDMPPSLMRVPPNITPVAMPPEVPGSSQLGSLDNQGYAGPGMGARQYDFTLWALDTDKLPVSARMTTVQIHELLEAHEVTKTPPVLVRNTRNL